MGDSPSRNGWQEGAQVLGSIVVAIFKTIRWLVRWHPLLTGAVLSILLAYMWYRIVGLIVGVVVVFTAGLLWWLRDFDSLNAWVLQRLRAGWRREFVYAIHWHKMLSACRLKQFVALDGVTCDPYSDLVTMKVSTEPPFGWEPLLSVMAKQFSADRASLVDSTRDFVRIRFRHRDRLGEIIPPFSLQEDEIDLAAVPVGITEDGDRFNVRVQGTHVLVGGCTGSGKSGFIWSLVHSVAPLILAGKILIWAVDPKGGMELTRGSPLFDRYSCPTLADGDTINAEVYEPMVRFLEDAAGLMVSRATRLRTTTRKHEATVEDPAVIVIIDELLTFTDHLPDDGRLRLRERSKNALKILLTQGRSTGVTVVGAVQDPHKDTVKMRDLFVTRVALRMTDEEQADMVLGEGSRKRGAYCERIGELEHGVGYVRLHNQQTPTRFRLSWVDDPQIDYLVSEFAPQRPSGLVVPKLDVVEGLDVADAEAIEFLRSQEVQI